MNAAVKTKTETETVPAEFKVEVPQTIRSEYKLIPWKDLMVSPTNPRRKINDVTIRSLAESIRMQGILEPLIVRQVGDKYEIVCGERRYRAAEIAELEELPCLVQELSDEQVLDIQIHENLHREDVHPMDEAYGYHFLQEKLGCDAKELALRVGKSEGYVLNRLKLNQLIKEGQRDIDNGHLPLVYALEMAKYAPDIQTLIYREVYKKEGMYKRDKYVQVPLKGETVSFKWLAEWINTNIHHMLSKAPFDPEATNLRADGLACTSCPDRTGAAVSLFETNQIGKKDACLNPPCFQGKIENHVQLRRQELADLRKVEISEVPLVRSRCYADGTNYFGSESATLIDGKNRNGSGKTCDHAISGIDIEPENYGHTVQVCLKATQCKIHWRSSNAPSTGDSSKGKSDEEQAIERLESHRARREEIWNAKVAEAVRILVFKQAAEAFEKKFRITDVGTDFLSQLVAQFWRMTAAGDSNNLTRVVRLLLSDWKTKSDKGDDMYMLDHSNGIDSFKKLERGLQIRILFLLIHGSKGTIYHGNDYSSQKEVRELASEFKVDHLQIDAEVRLELSPNKYKEVHQTYLDSLKGESKDITIPRLFSEKWQPRDL